MVKTNVQGRTKAVARLSVRDIAIWVTLIALLALAFSPVVTRSHVEGFSYLTETMSAMAPDFSVTDQIWTMTSSFFYLSRPGTVWAIVPLTGVFPGQGYNALMWLALPVFLTGVLLLCRLWVGASWLASCAVLLAIPLIADVNFFFNSNLPASAVSIAGIALLIWKRTILTAFISGLVLSLAILMRLDQLLFLPLYCLLVVLGPFNPHAMALRLCAALLGGFLVHGGMALIDPAAADLILRIQVTSTADALWERGDASILHLFARDVRAFSNAYFAALPALVGGLPIAVRQSVSRWRGWNSLFELEWVLPTLLFTYPFAIYAVTLGKYYDPRGYLTILPFIAPAVALGLDRWVFDPLRSSSSLAKSRSGLILALFVALPVVLPGVIGPVSLLKSSSETESAAPSLTGRVWYTDTWREWQYRFVDAEMYAAALVAKAEETADTSVIVTASWTEDRQLQHALTFSGYRPAAPENSACADVSQAWDHPGQGRLLHLRTHVPFLPDYPANTSALMVAAGEKCLRSFAMSQRIAAQPNVAFVSLPAPDLALPALEGGGYALPDKAIDMLSEAALETLADRFPRSDPEKAAARLIETSRAKLNINRALGVGD